MYLEYMRIIGQGYLEEYQEILMSLYKKAYELNPEAFRLSNPNNIKFIIVNYDQRHFHNSWSQLYFVLTNNANMDLQVIDAYPESYNDYSDYQFDSAFFKDYLTKYNGIEQKNLVHFTDITHYIKYFNEPKEQFLEDFNHFKNNRRQEMKRLIGEEGSTYQQHVNYPSSYYAKNAARYSYSLLDLSPILDKVSDEDFEYQLDQAIAAYENSLYLASCATLGVCLETLCKILLKKHKIKVKDSDGTMLDALAQKLRENQIISYKFNSRIDVCYKVRNLASHTSPGKVLQHDCHFILNTIHEIVDVYF